MKSIKESAEEYAVEMGYPVDTGEHNRCVSRYLAGAKYALEMAAQAVEREKRVQGLARVTLASQIRNLIPE